MDVDPVAADAEVDPFRPSAVASSSRRNWAFDQTA
jgi:hypothetical protein